MNTNIDKASPKSSLYKQKSVPETHELNSALTKNSDFGKKEDVLSKAKKGTNVTISEAIKDFSKIKKAVDDAPEVDNSVKIAALKQQINAGKYDIDYDQLADNLLSKEF